MRHADGTEETLELARYPVEGDAAPSVILMEKQNRDVVSLPPMTLKPARTPEPTPEPPAETPQP